MDNPEYQQDLINMELIIFDFYCGLFGARDRLNSYQEKDLKELPEKIELYPILHTLKDINASYNENIQQP